MDLRLDGQTAVVTGASWGIGLAVNRGLVAEGVRVTAGALRSSAELDELAGAGLAPVVEVDLAEPGGPARLVAAAIPAPGRPLFEAAAATFSLHSPAKATTTIDDRGPLLLITAGQDHTVPDAITKSTLSQYRHPHAISDLFQFPDRGHSLTIDHGWRDVASACLHWLYKNSLS